MPNRNQLLRVVVYSFIKLSQIPHWVRPCAELQMVQKGMQLWPCPLELTVLDRDRPVINKDYRWMPGTHFHRPASAGTQGMAGGVSEAMTSEPNLGRGMC